MFCICGGRDGDKRRATRICTRDIVVPGTQGIIVVIDPGICRSVDGYYLVVGAGIV